MGKRTSDTIDSLVADLQPVRPVRLGWLFAGLLAIEIVALAGAAYVSGLRYDLAERSSEPAFWVFLLLLAFGAAAGAVVALRMSVPGRESSGALLGTTVSVPVIAGLAVLALAPWGGNWAGVQALVDGCWRCVTLTAVTAIAPWIVFLVVVSRLAPLRELRIGFFTGLSVLLVGALATSLHCPAGDSYHLAFGHYFPVAVIAIAASAASSLFLRRAV